MLRKRAAQEAFILAERNYEATASSTRLCEPLHDRQSSLRRVNERSFVLGHVLVALKTTGSEFPKPANHEIPVVVLGVLPNVGLLAIATCRFGASTSSSKKDRGHWCGSWRVSSTISYIECAWFLATNNLLPSSEQQLVNCDTVDPGCNGELMDNAYASAKKNVMWTETGHSYIATKGTCMASSCTAWEASSW